MVSKVFEMRLGKSKTVVFVVVLNRLFHILQWDNSISPSLLGHSRTPGEPITFGIGETWGSGQWGGLLESWGAGVDLLSSRLHYQMGLQRCWFLQAWQSRSPFPQSCKGATGLWFSRLTEPIWREDILLSEGKQGLRPSAPGFKEEGCSFKGTGGGTDEDQERGWKGRVASLHVTVWSCLRASGCRHMLLFTSVGSTETDAEDERLMYLLWGWQN